MSCPRCASPIGPDQDWCLECGAPARTRLAPTPNWQLPTVAVGAIVLLAGALLAFAFVKLTSDDDIPAGATPTAVIPTTPPAVITPPPAVTSTAPGQVTTPGATTTPGAATTPGASTTPGATTTPGETTTPGTTTGNNPAPRTTPTPP